MFIQDLLINFEFKSGFFVSILLPLLLALILGKVFCSFFCPANTIFELFRKFYSKKNVKELANGRRIRIFILLLILLLVFLLKIPLFNYLSLPGIFSLELQKIAFHKKLSLFWIFLLFLVFVEFIFKKRIWCNYICPQGSFIGLLISPKTLKIIKRERLHDSCIGCRQCVISCPFDLNPMDGNIYPQCTNCFECYVTCRKIHKENATLGFKF